METAAAVEGGTQPIETLPNASNMVTSNAAAERSAPGARDEEEDDDADGAADGTQRNDAKGGEQIRELRRFFAGKILGALPCVQDAPPECTWSTAWVHLTQQRRTHVGAAFRPIAELDPGAITVKNRLGSRLLRW